MGRGLDPCLEECLPPRNLLLVAIPQSGHILGEPMTGVRGALGCRSHTPFVRTQSPSWLAGCLRFSPLECLFGWTHPLQTARPGLVCGTRPCPPPATFPEENAAPPGPHTTPATALKVGAGRRSQNCLESKQLRTQSGLARRLAATKGQCEGGPWSRRDPFSSLITRPAC